MTRILKISFMLIMVAAIAAGCDASKKGQCGCPNKKGLVGY